VTRDVFPKEENHKQLKTIHLRLVMNITEGLFI
jgi:hypothetical protein